MRCPDCKEPHDRLAVRCGCGYRFPPVAEPGRSERVREASDRQPSDRTPRSQATRPTDAPAKPARDANPAPRRARESGSLVKRVPRAVDPNDLQPRFRGNARVLFSLHVINLAKTACSLGLYHFWAKVQVRRYLYAHTEFQGDRFAYHGEGKELLRGWAKIVGIFGAIWAFTTWLEWGLKLEWASLVGHLLFFLVGILVLPAAIVGSTRFRLSRTSWRGIRFSFHGRAKEFARLFVRGACLSAVTFGIYTPFMQVAVRRFMVSNTRFGDLAFGFDGDAKPLVGPYIVSMLLYAPTLTLSSYWYRAIRDKHLWHHTRVGDARFVSSVTPYGLFKLTVRTFILTYMTLGLGKPWAEVMRLKYLCENLKIEGPLDVAGVVQRIQVATAAGEGLTDFIETSFFDLEVGL